MAQQLILNRDVTKEECPWLKEDLNAGTYVYLYEGHTYGCISPNGTAVTFMPDETPFFEIPLDSFDPCE